jgi:hypothetical protein
MLYRETLALHWVRPWPGLPITMMVLLVDAALVSLLFITPGVLLIVRDSWRRARH